MIVLANDILLLIDSLEVILNGKLVVADNGGIILAVKEPDLPHIILSPRASPDILAEEYCSVAEVLYKRAVIDNDKLLIPITLHHVGPHKVKYMICKDRIRGILKYCYSLK